MKERRAITQKLRAARRPTSLRPHFQSSPALYTSPHERFPAVARGGELANPDTRARSTVLKTKTRLTPSARPGIITSLPLKPHTLVISHTPPPPPVFLFPFLRFPWPSPRLPSLCTPCRSAAAGPVGLDKDQKRMTGRKVAELSSSGRSLAGRGIDVGPSHCGSSYRAHGDLRGSGTWQSATPDAR